MTKTTSLSHQPCGVYHAWDWSVLIVAQGDAGVHSCGTSGREVTGDECHRRYYQRDNEKGERVGRAHPVEQRRRDAGQGDGRDEPGRDPREAELHPLD